MNAPLAALLLALLLPATAHADVAACRTPWQMHAGEGPVTWGFDMGSHGNIAEYDYATIPTPSGPGWVPAPDEQLVNYDLGQDSTLCGVVDCRFGGEFTYFKTIVYLPPQLNFSTAWVDVQSVDDGVRMTVFNPQTPLGVTDPNGYAFLPSGVSSDLLPYMANESWNTVVLTHVDDCCSNAWITGVDFYVEVEGRPEAVPIDCDIADDDGDGFPPAGGDCDDDDPLVYPGAVEVLDGVDQDCDGVVDEEPLDGGTWFEDEDGDGWGSEQATTACRQPGQVAKAGDCDDQDDAIFPGQEESWYDGVDQACDGGDDFDADGDGAPLDEDCDDQDEGVFVGASELCDSVYQDCDGALSPCTLDEPVLEGEQAGDYAGFSVAGPGDVDLDGVPDLLVGARGADAVYLVSGAGSQVLAEAPRLVGEVASWAGVAVDGAGDTDGDGWPDLVVGARNDDLGGDDAGAAYLVRGPVGSGLLRDHVTLLGEGPGDNAGIAVAGPGDLDGDGLADLAVGARNHDAGGSNAGAVYLLFGPISSGTLGDEGVKLLGKQSGDLAGRSLAAAGDIDGDGQQDLLVGALFAHQAGTVYVVTDQDLDTELVGVEPRRQRGPLAGRGGRHRRGRAGRPHRGSAGRLTERRQLGHRLPGPGPGDRGHPGLGRGFAAGGEHRRQRRAVRHRRRRERGWGPGSGGRRLQERARRQRPGSGLRGLRADQRNRGAVRGHQADGAGGQRPGRRGRLQGG